ncbi:phytanoyl-CoA dioxygenase family protein [Marinomonas sp. 5E14-1]|uniref:phytanoyl-CoA dioxygenase family protein n=1 Tax=Marinomonas sp. 5E14-1 TaxID=3153922 RepID=UPI003263233B
MESTSICQLETFQKTGFLKLSNIIDEESITTLRGQFWREISNTFGISLSDPSAWFHNPSNPVGGSGAKRLNGMGPMMRDLKASGKFDKIEAMMQSAIDPIFVDNTWRPLDLWYSLLSFPGSEAKWNVPHKSWHCDEPIVVGDSNPWSLFVFLLLDDVSVDMGPTTVVSGSHRRAEQLAERIASSNQEAAIKAFDSVNNGLIDDPKNTRLLTTDNVLEPLKQEDPWMKALVTEGTPEQRIQQFVQEGDSYHGIGQKVVSLTGSAGDIILLNPRCLHSTSANISSLPRQIIRLDFRRHA